MRALTRAALSLLTKPGISPVFHPMMRDRAAIFMLHRFRMPEHGVEGIDPGWLRSALSLLRHRRYELLDLGEVFRRLKGDGPPLGRAVAFTIDDGYLDHALVAAPVFAEFDCPVTTFVCTGFLDRKLWFWWDRIEYILRHSARRELSVRSGEAEIRLSLANDAERSRAIETFTAHCKTLPESAKLAAIETLATAAEVDVPVTPPPGCAPMTWDQLRACEERGMSFGAHTLTHPILARCDDEQSRREIAGSWERLKQEARRPVPVFCYPNGGWGDFGEREVGTLDSLGFQGSVVGAWGVADGRTLRETAGESFRVRRMAMPDDLPLLIQYVSGLEQLKLSLRRR